MVLFAVSESRLKVVERSMPSRLGINLVVPGKPWMGNGVSRCDTEQSRA